MRRTFHSIGFRKTPSPKTSSGCRHRRLHAPSDRTPPIERNRAQHLRSSERKVTSEAVSQTSPGANWGGRARRARSARRRSSCCTGLEMWGLVLRWVAYSRPPKMELCRHLPVASGDGEGVVHLSWLASTWPKKVKELPLEAPHWPHRKGSGLLMYDVSRLDSEESCYGRREKNLRSASSCPRCTSEMVVAADGGITAPVKISPMCCCCKGMKCQGSCVFLCSSIYFAWALKA